jgi:hypothetical protein
VDEILMSLMNLEEHGIPWCSLSTNLRRQQGFRLHLVLSPIRRSGAHYKGPFSFELSEPTRKLFCGMQQDCGSKEPTPDIGPPCLAHSTHFAIAIIYLTTVKGIKYACVLW